MSDPRNVAHDKKVTQQKQHDDEKAAVADERRGDSETAENPKSEQVPGEFEKSAAVLSKLKELEFHSRANIETLAQLTLTIDDELKQREFSDSVGALYSAQNEFQTQIAALVESYAVKCESLKPSA